MNEIDEARDIREKMRDPMYLPEIIYLHKNTFEVCVPERIDVIGRDGDIVGVYRLDSTMIIKKGVTTLEPISLTIKS